MPHGAADCVPADSHGRRIAILVVAYNALTTLSKVLKRIPKDVCANIDEVAVFDDASNDETYELAVGYKTLFGDGKLNIMRNGIRRQSETGLPLLDRQGL
jgi:glycosyltransferase involved in cell wall biosynthesis